MAFLYATQKATLSTDKRLEEEATNHPQIKQRKEMKQPRLAVMGDRGGKQSEPEGSIRSTARCHRESPKFRSSRRGQFSRGRKLRSSCRQFGDTLEGVKGGASGVKHSLPKNLQSRRRNGRAVNIFPGRRPARIISLPLFMFPTWVCKTAAPRPLCILLPRLQLQRLFPPAPWNLLSPRFHSIS